MEALAGIGTVLGIFAIIFFDVPDRINRWRHGIFVVPKKIVLKKSNWTNNRQIQIFNNKPYPIYRVQLRISERHSGSSIDEIGIKADGESRVIGKDFSLDLNAFVVNGTNSKGLKWRRVFIGRINPNSSVCIDLKIPEISSESTILLKITDYKREDGSILEQGSSVAVSFEIKD